MKTHLLPRTAVAKAFAAQSARNLRWEGTSEVCVSEIDGMTGYSYKTVSSTRCTPKIRCEVRRPESGGRAWLQFFYVR